ncbi:phage replication protein [Bacillus cereus VD133]|uniref:Phage replication protein n=1 Tax=Bacillus cereus VD133 TaxID=1053233 RepID=A0A9W5UZZ2_BACCE|nr:conserved phage C-terminal domain-containing protein [Bacillus cereus]EOO28648.1 phage replication protein [Bacillus cereus VD133]
MATFRVNKSKNYTTINNIGLRDERLSWKAKGILSYILSLPDDWVFYMEEISTHAKDGIDSLRVGMKELKKFGYVRRFPVKNEKGKITSWETIIYEVPQVENPHMENPQVEKPQMEVPFMENPTLLSTKELSTNIPNTDKQNNTMSSSNEEDNQSSIPYQEILDYLNEKATKNFNHKAEAHRKLIRARWNEGYTIEKFKTVIDNKVSQWLGQFDRDNKPLDRYLRPSTLFAQKHFDNYLNETVKGAKNNDPVARNGAVYYNETEFDF